MPSIISVNWNDVAEFNSYEVFYRPTDGNQQSVITSQTTVQLTSLLGNKAYEVFAVGFSANNTLPSRSNTVEILQGKYNYFLSCIIAIFINSGFH